MNTKQDTTSKPRKWSAILLLLCGELWVFASEIAIGSPYVSRSFGEACQHEIVLMNVSLLLNLIAFWSFLFVVLSVWRCSARVSRIVQIIWWSIVLLGQCGWVYLSLRCGY